jgi:hypothetical protein
MRRDSSFGAMSLRQLSLRVAGVRRVGAGLSSTADGHFYQQGHGNMKKGIFAGLVIAAAALAGAEGAQAQSTIPISVEGRLDLGVPVGDAADVLEPGVGFGITGAFQLTPLFGLYGGWSSFEFDVDDLDDEITSDGFELGGRVTLGTGGGIYNPYFQIGALFQDDETGIEAGLGGFYPVGQNLSLTPMVRYRNIDELDYVTVGVGLNLRF